MIIKKVLLQEIDYEKKEYDKSLMDSIKRQGVTIPIKVSYKNDRYQCIDGHKRITILNELYSNDYRVLITIANDFTKSGSNFWGIKNHH